MSLVFHSSCEMYIGMWVVIRSNYVHERTGVHVEILFKESTALNMLIKGLFKVEASVTNKVREFASV